MGQSFNCVVGKSPWLSWIASIVEKIFDKTNEKVTTPPLKRSKRTSIEENDSEAVSITFLTESVKSKEAEKSELMKELDLCKESLQKQRDLIECLEDKINVQHELIVKGEEELIIAREDLENSKKKYSQKIRQV